MEDFSSRITRLSQELKALAVDLEWTAANESSAPEQDRMMDASGAGLLLGGSPGPALDQDRGIALNDRSDLGVPFGTDDPGARCHGVPAPGVLKSSMSTLSSACRKA